MKNQAYITSYSQAIWKQFKKNKIACFALTVLFCFFVVGLYAPVFASSKPLVILWRGKLYFPLIRYLFFSGFFSKPIDLFYNILMFLFPLGLLFGFIFKKRIWQIVLLTGMMQWTIFFLIMFFGVKDPAHSADLKEKHLALKKKQEMSLLGIGQLRWESELSFFNPYEQINMLLRYKQRKDQHNRLKESAARFQLDNQHSMPTLWQMERDNIEAKKELFRRTMQDNSKAYHQALAQFPDLIKGDSNKEIPPSVMYSIQAYRNAKGELYYQEEKEAWLEKESQKMRILIPAMFRSFHWEDDAGGSQAMNRYVPWWERTRVNRKDLVAGLIFGIRISLVVGISAVILALAIGIPVGTISGYFAGKTDIVICRFIEIWEAMPMFFTLLVVIAVTQSKSIFLIVSVIGIFGWTSFGRFIRGEVLKQRNLSYVFACKSLGFNNLRIMFSHIMPNAIPPILTLFPFSMMAAIISEASLSFLGLGEEGSTSWGVLMDEGRSVFPGESYLLWPPAILLTCLLICIALVGDALRDAIDPKMR